MEILKQNPSPVQIQEFLQKFQTGNDVELLRLVSTLLKHTIPQIYLILPETCQIVISRVFRTTVGLGNLIARIGLLARSKADLHQDISKALDAHTHLLDRVLAPGLVRELEANATPLTRKEIDKLLFKGKIYSVIREADHSFHDFFIPPLFRSLDAYALYLTKELVLYGDARSYIMSIISLGGTNSFFEVMLSRENVGHLRVAAQSLKRFERKTLLIKFTDFIYARHLPSSVTSEKIISMSVLSNLFLDNSLWDDLLLERIVSRYNFNLNLLVCLMVAKPEELASKQLSVWGNAELQRHEPIIKQEYRTHLLLNLCAQLNMADLQCLLKSSSFVTAISNRLSSLSDQVKYCGILFSDRVCALADMPTIFNIDDTMSLNQIEIPLITIQRSQFAMSCDDAWDIFESPTIIEVDDTQDVKDLDSKLQPLSLLDSKKSMNASEIDMSDDEDDPTLANNDKIAAPIYIRDLLSYLSVDKKDKLAYEKELMALKECPTLLRKKSTFGNEVSFYAEDLLTMLAGLTNHYENPQFETLKLNAMIAVVVSYSQVTNHLCKLLLTGDYSLQQRLCLLSAMSLGARALRGFKDEVVVNSFIASDFSTKLLPKELHEKYTQAESGYAQIELSIQDEIMTDAAEQAQNEIYGGKVLRVSAGLKRQSQPTSTSADQLSNFSTIVGKRFYFPLIAVWYESGGINIGHYTPILVAHFVRTLSLIFHCANPSAIDLNDMAREYLMLVTPVLQSAEIDQLPVIESIVTGVLVIMETLDQTFLMTHFDGELQIIKNTITGFWETLIDDRVKSLCAGLLLKLANIKDSMRKTILDQINGGLYA